MQAIYCELRDKCDFEIIVIDNHCPELQTQLEKKGVLRDKGGDYMKLLATAERPWLKYATYDQKLSHWNAKNSGVMASDGEFLWFVDSHCVPSQGSLIRMFDYYKASHELLHGTLHMPLSYMLEQPGLELIYKLVTDPEHGVVGYAFTRYKEKKCWSYEVPCMSTCGMMMSRKIYDALGGWPSGMGIYGGGEHFVNFALAVMGYSINIFTAQPLYHYAAPRGYHYNYLDYHRNRTIATYMFGGKKWAYKYIMGIKPHDKSADSHKEAIYASIVGNELCMEQRLHIKSQQTKTICAWLKEQDIILPDDMIDHTPVE